MNTKLDKVAILGIGGGGGKILQSVAHTYAAKWTTLAYLDTDVKDLEFVDGVLQSPLGSTWTQGQGTGGDPAVGENATSASLGRIKELVQGNQLLVVVACLGGGTGSGGVQAVARLARDLNLLTMFVVTLPFTNEGNSRRTTADQALAQLRQSADVVIAIDNDLLYTSFPATTPIREAFALANRLLADGVVGLAELIRCQGILPIDYASLKALLRKRDAQCGFGVGRAPRPGDAVAALDALFACPTLGGADFVQQADVIVATIICGSDLAIGDLNVCMQALHQRLNPASRVIMGTNLVEDKPDSITLTMLAIRYAKTAGSEPGTPANDSLGLPLPSSDTGARPAAKRAKGAHPAAATRQFKLALGDDHQLGIFGNATPTTYQGANLDIPTYLRRGLTVDSGT